eukprot:jgi/Mesvir1/5313/Mv15407-RA.1
MALQAVLDDTHDRTIRSCEWSPNGEMLACASFDATVSIWRYQGGEFECTSTLEGHECEVKSVAWSPCGRMLATCSRDRSVWIWEPHGTEFECVSVLSGHSQDVKMVTWHPSLRMLLSCSYDDSIKVWAEDRDAEDWACIQTLQGPTQGHGSTVWGISLNADGSRMVSCSDDMTLMVWGWEDDASTENGDAAAGTQKVAGKWKNLCSLGGYHSRTIFSVHWSSLNGLIATGAADDNLRLFGETTPEGEGEADAGVPSYRMLLCQDKAHALDINCVRWNPTDKKMLASAGDDMVVKIWEVVGLT